MSTKTMDAEQMAEQMTDHTSKHSLTEIGTQIEGLRADFTPEEQQVLTSLRTRYEQGLDLFSEREMARLRFMRWLYQNGYFPRPRRANRPRKASAQADE